jgi:asparagine synthase (glutamine-hydrolysing)
MCGISGSVDKSCTEAYVNAMVRALTHRGPDASGTRVFSQCVLGHNRLRVIDLNPEADQPMTNEDETVWVVFNGEIYNFIQLRAELEASGHRFRSQTDTEVLVHLYEEYGADLGRHLRGMFAFAIWDERRHELVLTRDRLGIKPLYYRVDGTRLDFASERRALTRLGDSLDLQALGAYLRLGWIPGPGTIIGGVNELPPGHTLTWSDGAFGVEAYWSPSFDPHEPVEAPSQDELRETLIDVMARHIVADVPVGLFLSSGVDSVILAALAKRVSPDIRAHTVAFKDGNDEAPEARALAARLGLDHVTVEISGSEVVGQLDAVIGAMDQPTVDGVNSWVISRAVRDAGLIVAISGLGGDELFNGYSTFRHVPRIVRLGAALRGVPQRIRSVPASASGCWARTAHSRGSRALGAIAAGGWGEAYASVRGLFGPMELARIWGPARQRTEPSPVRIPWSHSLSGPAMVSQLEMANYLPYQLLRDTDCMSMAHGLEVRVPLLDDPLVDMAVAGQQALGVDWGKEKLVAAVDPGLAFLAERPKRTFTLPFDRWMRGPLSERSREALVQLRKANLGFDPEQLKKLWEGYERGWVGWRPIWALVVMSVWLDANSVTPPAG